MSPSVQIGVIYPQTELPTDPATLRAYATAGALTLAT
jgi:hypothetical protein